MVKDISYIRDGIELESNIYLGFIMASYIFLNSML